MPQLQAVQSSVSVNTNAVLEELAFASLQSVGGSVSISDNSALAAISFAVGLFCICLSSVQCVFQSLLDAAQRIG